MMKPLSLLVLMIFGFGVRVGATTWVGASFKSYAGAGFSKRSCVSLSPGASNLNAGRLLTLHTAPLITVTGYFNPESTTYGTPSSSDQFTVSGSSLTAGITLSAPAGFQISTNRSSSYSSSIIIGSAGTYGPASVYIRIAARTGVLAAGYSGAVTLTSPGAITVSSNVIYGQVNPFPMRIVLYDQSKYYGDVLTSYTATGYIPTGANGEILTGATVTNDATASSATAGAGSTYYEGISAATGIGNFNLNNYTIFYAGFNGTIQPAPVLVRANNEIKVYGTTLTGDNTAMDFNSLGLQNGETIGSVSLAYGVGNNPTDGVATYPGSVTVSNAMGGTYNPANYSVAYAGADLVVTPAPLSINASGQNKIYGTALTPAAIVTAFIATGLQNNETLGSVSIAYGAGSAATAPVGTYATSVIAGNLRGGTANLLNYSVNYAAGPLVVTPKPVTVVATTYLKTYGTQLSSGPAFANFAAPALANGETIGSVSLIFETGSKATDPVGAYPLSAQPADATGGSFAASNYMLTYLPADLIVGASPLIITPVAVTKVYGNTLISASGKTGFTTTLMQNGETVGSVTLIYGSGNQAADTTGNYAGSVAASAASGGTYNPANYLVSYAAATLAVTPAPLTVTAQAATKIYGTVLTGSTGSTLFTAAGLQNNETVGSITISYGTGAAAFSPAGVYPGQIFLNQVTGGIFNIRNYLVTYIPAALTVTPVALLISAGILYKTYGTTLSAGTGSTTFQVTGLQNSDKVSTVSFVPGTGAAPSALVGIYPGSVSISAASGPGFIPANYQITYRPGVLNVTQAPLFIQTGDVAKSYGSGLVGTRISAGLTRPAPGGITSPGFTVSGLQNGETVGSLLLSYGPGAAATAPVGAYRAAVLGSQATGGTFNSGNYSINYTARNLLVNPAQLVVTVSSVNKFYGVFLTGASGSSAFTVTGLQNEEKAAYITTAYGPGASAEDEPGTYTRSVTGSGLSGGTILPADYQITYLPGTLVVGTPMPVIAVLSQPDCSADLGTFIVQNYNPAAIYILSAPGSGSQAGPVFTVSAGTYTLTALAPESFTSPVSLPFSIEPSLPCPKLVITNPAVVNDPSTVNLTLPGITAGSTPGLTYTYFSDSSAAIPVTAPGMISIPGVYYIKGTNTAGISVVGRVIVTISYAIFIPNIFTPNGDGKNDRFVILRLSHFPGSSLQILNRWGNSIYHSADYQNTWDGGGVEAGTYYYLLTLKEGETSSIHRGWVQILR